MKTLLIAMSGGVDSSVAALLTKEQGFHCHGVMMKLFSPADLSPSARESQTEASTDAARAVAKRLGMPFAEVDLSEEFRTCVMSYFKDSYYRGETPNPCVECNRRMKFGALLKVADARGLDGIATGHYARIDHSGPRTLLLRAKDERKDQSYVLWQLTQAVLSRTLLPLGELSKEEVRAIAASAGFQNARVGDSQDICFVPDGDYVAFLEHFTRETYPGGEFVDAEGNFLGHHDGMIRYTVGQRKGLGIAFGAPTYVLSKDAATNRVMLGGNDALFSHELTAREANWIAIESLTAHRRVKAKIRYNGPLADAEVEPLDATHFRLRFDNAQRAVTPGQSVVLYEDDAVLGGGIIE